jgi:cytochrome c oxidase subunit I+III
MTLPAQQWPVIAALTYLGGVMLIAFARRELQGAGQGWFRLILAAAYAAVLAAYGVDLWSLHSAGLDPTESGFGAVVYGVAAWQGVHLCALLVMVGYTLARSWSGLLNEQRRLTFDNTGLFLLYTAGQGLAGLMLVHASRWATG